MKLEISLFLLLAHISHGKKKMSNDGDTGAGGSCGSQAACITAISVISISYLISQSHLSNPSLNLISISFVLLSADLHFLLLHAGLWDLQVPNEVRGGQRIRGEG